MGTKSKPGKFDCYAKAAPDEPVFVLLARDLSAPGTIREWAARREREIRAGRKPESDRAMIEEALVCATDMERWRRDQADKPAAKKSK